jgi:hypothetical protein
MLSTTISNLSSYYACEALFNVVKVCKRYAIQRYFNRIFDSTCRLMGDPNPEVRLYENIVIQAGWRAESGSQG